jgi:DNA-binding LacI/PurR family transcriptional regulator
LRLTGASLTLFYFYYFPFMKNRQATIRDIAIKLQISISTVSRALRNAADVNPETKKAVLSLAHELNYEPNRVAQSLRSKRTKTLGVVVPEINLHFFSSAISGIQEYSSRYNYGVMICQSLESVETEKSNLHMLLSNRVDGLLVSLSSETDSYDHLRTLIEKKIPLVLFDRICTEVDTTKVVVDDYNGAFKAVEHLIITGCRSIAFVGGPKHLYICKERLKGYTDALLKYNMPVSGELILHCTHLSKDPVHAMHQLLKQNEKPDAIFAMNDPIAIIIMQVLKEKGISIPEEMSVIGFTNEPVSQFIEPSLTTVSQPSYEMGQVAAQLFLEQLENKEAVPFVTKVLPTELIIRNSTRKIPRGAPYS